MINFTKMEGLGNDYVYIDCTKKDLKDASNLAKIISDRHFGVGSDGLILIKNSNKADFRMQMFNSDGSEAEMCGNGIRCVGKYVYDNGLTQKKILTIETLAGIKTLELNIEEGKVKTVKVDMGEPILDFSLIPVTDVCEYESDEKIKFYKLNIEVEKEQKEFTCVSMGNPHAINYVKNVKDLNINKYGPIIEKDKHFPNKTNVEFIELIDNNNIKMRVWERGAGETLACGTGACASVVASVLNGYTDRNVTVELLGGNLNIEWNKENNHVYMTGSATKVFEGKIDEENILNKLFCKG